MHPVPVGQNIAVVGSGRRIGTAGVPSASAEGIAREHLVWRSRGYLPHLDAPALVQHLVFRLADSLPKGIGRQVSVQRPSDRVAEVDAALDAGHGERLLLNAPVARLIESALLLFDSDRYALLAWCVMPNHVHALVQAMSGYGVHGIMHSWKSFTAKQANRLLDRTGTFWAPEYFDRYMRNDHHLARTIACIEGNPVKAGLCDNISDWRFSSAWPGCSGRDARGPNMPL